jgi:hypothetical protein
MNTVLTFYFQDGTVHEVLDEDDLLWNILKGKNFDWSKPLVLDSVSGIIEKRVILNMKKVNKINCRKN